MKAKKIVIILMSVILSAGISCTAFADGLNWSSSSIDVNGATVNLSVNVHANYSTYDSKAKYYAGAYNSKGTLVYGTTSDINTIKYTECDPKPCEDSANGVDSADSAAIEGWSDIGK